MELRDHPVIQNMERTGYPDGKEPQQPVCPVCDREADVFYMNVRDDILGCESCVNKCGAWEIDKKRRLKSVEVQRYYHSGYRVGIEEWCKANNK